MRSWAVALVVSLALFASSVDANWKLSEYYVDVPLLTPAYNASEWLGANIVPSHALSTLNVGIYGLAEGNCTIGAYECTEPSMIRGPAEATAALLPGVYATTINNRTCMMLRPGPSDLTPGYLHLRLFADPSVNSTRFSVKLFVFNDQPGSIKVSAYVSARDVFDSSAVGALWLETAHEADAAPTWTQGQTFEFDAAISASLTAPVNYFVVIETANKTDITLFDAIGLCDIAARGSPYTTVDPPPVTPEAPPIVCAAVVQAVDSWTERTSAFFSTRVALLVGVQDDNVTVTSVKAGPATDDQEETTLVCFRTYGAAWFTVIDMLLESSASTFGWTVTTAYRADNPQFLRIIGLSGGAIAGIIIGMMFLSGGVVALAVFFRDRRLSRNAAQRTKDRPIHMQELPADE